MNSQLSPEELADAAAQAAAEKLGFDIAAYRVAEVIPLAEIFLICSAKNERQVSAIVDAVAERLAKLGERLIFREGHRDDQWVLLNYPDIVVHIQHQDARSHYALDRLWGDCPLVALDIAAEDKLADQVEHVDQADQTDQTAQFSVGVR